MNSNDNQYQELQSEVLKNTKRQNRPSNKNFQ